jgi:Fur family zinc uptake transcriptional regulator
MDGESRHAIDLPGHGTVAMKQMGKAKPDWAAQVESACSASGLKLTSLRRQVLEIIAKAPKPLGAYAIIEELSRAQDKQVAPPTVYRTLELFLENGFLHKIESRNAYAPCEHLDHRHHGILLICGTCGKTDEVESASVEKLLKATAARKGFLATRQIIEVEGLCQGCHNGAADGKIVLGEAIGAK